MCCRLVLTINDEVKSEIIENFHIKEPEKIPNFSSYNVAPGSPVPVVYEGNAIVVENMMWGFVPLYSERAAQILPNARIETVNVKPTFRGALGGQRCIIPANGYYEWKKSEDGSKQPFYIFRKDGGVLAFAGLYQEVKVEGKKVNQFTILTQQAVGDLSEIHDRMPVIIPNEMIDIWLEKAELSSDFIPNMIRSGIKNTSNMEFYPVSGEVNSVKNDNSELVKRVE